MISRIPFASLVALLRLAIRNGGVHPFRLHVLAIMALRYTLFEPLRLAERWRFDRAIADHTLEQDPIFILGHWRSGTSYLQTLLSDDPRFATSTLYRSIFADISGVSESWLKPAMNAVARTLGLTFSLQRLPLNLDIPAEADVALCSQLNGCSYTWGHIFPKRFDQWMKEGVLEPDPSWLDPYDLFIRKLSRASGGRRLVIKSPGDTARIALLASRYPKALFIYIHRDPIAVFHSNLYFWQVILREYSLHKLIDPEVEDIIIRTYPKVLQCYLDQRELIPESRRFELSYEALRDAPREEVARLYAHFELGEVPEMTSNLPHYTPQRYISSDDLEKRLREKWAIGFTEWGRHP